MRFFPFFALCIALTCAVGCSSSGPILKSQTHESLDDFHAAADPGYGVADPNAEFSQADLRRAQMEQVQAQMQDAQSGEVRDDFGRRKTLFGSGETRR